MTHGQIVNGLPVSGAWQDGDPVGRRRFGPATDRALEVGGTLPGARLAYETWGELAPGRDNAVLICHALTGDSHVSGESGPGHPTPGWWRGIVGPGLAIDTDRFYVVAPNVLGGCQGSTGPASRAPDGKPWGLRFPLLTTRDQVAAEYDLMRHIGIARWHAVVGPSLGGQRALEWAVGYPQQVGKLAVIASGASTTAEQAAWCHTQIQILELDPCFNGGDYYDFAPGNGPHRGLAIARQVAHTTYRCPRELEVRFGRDPGYREEPLTGGRLAVQAYLEHHGHKLARRFDAGSYRTLTRTMLTHDVGRGRGGLVRALAGVSADVLAIGVDSDRLFYPAQSKQIGRLTPRGETAIIRSAHGHDGFLIENDQVAALLAGFIG
ncbi:homoserine O-acetyltransferase MetX [Dermabacteraceae bacterium P13077]